MEEKTTTTKKNDKLEKVQKLLDEKSADVKLKVAAINKLQKQLTDQQEEAMKATTTLKAKEEETLANNQQHQREVQHLNFENEMSKNRITMLESQLQSQFQQTSNYAGCAFNAAHSQPPLNNQPPQQQYHHPSAPPQLYQQQGGPPPSGGQYIWQPGRGGWGGVTTGLNFVVDVDVWGW